MPCHRPCEECPWRRDVPTGRFSAAKFRALARNCRDDGHQIMACHKSPEGRPRVCAGWAAGVGYDAIGLRLARRLGWFDPAGLNVSGLSLYPDFEAMLAANGVPVPKRNLAWPLEGEGPARPGCAVPRQDLAKKDADSELFLSEVGGSCDKEEQRPRRSVD